MKLFKFFSKKYESDLPVTPRSVRVYSGGNAVTEDTSMKASALYSGVMYLSTQIAKLPCMVKTEDNKEVKGKLQKFLNIRPNPEMSAFNFWCFMMQAAIIKGNAYAEIERDTLGRVKALWPIPTEDVCVLRHPETKEIVYEIVGGSTNFVGQNAYLRENEIFHLRSFHTKDGIMGEGIVWYASEVLGITLGADRFANSLYTNGGMPSGTLEVPGGLSEEAMGRLKESWDSAHSGRKVGGTAVLEEGVSYKPISYAPDVLQFLESRKFSVIEIARFLRVPPTKLYDTETARYNNVEHANLEVAVDTLDAWARNVEGEIDIKLLNEGAGGLRAELDLHAIFRGDMDTRSQYFTRLMQTSSITPNEIRKKEGFAPYSGGDRYYIATNNYSPVDRLDEVVDSQINKSEPQPETPPQEDSEKEVNNAIVSYLTKAKN